MSLGIKFSDKWWAVKKRIKNLPQKSEALMFAFLKKDALTMVKEFENGIKKDSFGLKRLEDGTIQRKRRIGMERPETPLYGEGDNKKNNSYVKMLRIKKVKDGYKVKPSVARHYSGKIKLKDLYIVHEFGTIIKRGKSLIRIPARPAFLFAYNKVLRTRSLKENTQRIKRIITTFVKDGKVAQFKKEHDRLLKGLEKYEISD